MNWIKKWLSGEVKFGENSDVIVYWKPKYLPSVSRIPPSMKEKETEWFDTAEIKSERIWIYVCEEKGYKGEKGLFYILEVMSRERKILNSPSEINTITDASRFKWTYKCRVLHEFKSLPPLTQKELKENYDIKLGRKITYVNPRSKLVKDMVAGKIY